LHGIENHTIKVAIRNNTSDAVESMEKGRQELVDVKKRGRKMLGFRERGASSNPAHHDRASTNIAG
jgi:hypothetical protein